MSTGKKTVPEIRFSGFSEPWAQRKLGDMGSTFTGLSGKTNEDFGHGDAKFITYMNVYTNAVADLTMTEPIEVDSKQNKVKAGDVFFTTSSETPEEVGMSCVMPADMEDTYLNSFCFGYRQTERLDLNYLAYALRSNSFREQMVFLAQGISRYNISKNKVMEAEIAVPSSDEQSQIGSIFESLDSLISQHQHKYDTLVAVKKAMLEKMFPREGETVPQIRFAGFADPWEQRKFSDLVLIERGGSPRPIDDYITDAPDGLNWVKIGDAPEQGRYITKTAEKIKPEGLTKTRQVQPGDLILSNSMSFGKPYIMGINGCIHDGWLLIRDTQSRFDLKFLCHMLGTDQMLDQYRMFAAGSTVNNLNKELVGNTTVSLPSIEEQRVIGEYLESIDNLITLHQRKCEVLKNLKSALLNKMFVNTTE